MKPIFANPLITVVILLHGATLLTAQEPNLAIGKSVRATGQTWAWQFPQNLTDGDFETQSHPLASSGTVGFYYEIDLEEEFLIDRIVLFNRIGCCPERLTDYRVSIYQENNGSIGARRWTTRVREDGSNSGSGGQDVLTPDLDPNGTMTGRFIRIINLGSGAHSPQIAEVQVFEASVPVVQFFWADQGNITATGDPDLSTSATLSWQVDDANQLSIEPNVGTVAGPSGSIMVTPSGTTTYTLVATNDSAKTQQTITIGVDETMVEPTLTEFMAAGGGTLEDLSGRKHDWVEIYNPNPFSLNLDGYFLTDEPTFLPRWRFPAVSIPPTGYLIVFASGDNTTEAGPELHANFQLRKAGEYVALVSPDGTTVLQQFPDDYPVTREYPAQKENASYGIDSNGAIGFFTEPTPLVDNGTSVAGFVVDTKFVPDRAFFDSPIEVEITTLTDDAEIRYTIDGSEPTEDHGSVYENAISIAATTVLRAAAFKPGLAPTNIDTHTYIFLDDIVESPQLDTSVTQNPTYAPQMHAALTDLPTISLVMQSVTSRTNETRTSIELLLPDGSPGFQIDAGIKEFGGAFLAFAKRNFRLYFRGEYGDTKLRFPLFDGHDRTIRAVDVFDQLELRSGSHDMHLRGFYMSNRFTDDTLLDMGHLNPHGQFVHVYRNGVYWGMYHLRERWNADMHAQYLGGSDRDYEAINGNWNVNVWAAGTPYDGTGLAWDRAKSLRNDYEAIRDHVDLPQYIDYMLLFMFGDTENEYRCVGPTEAGTGFKFYLNDSDGFTRDVGNRTAMEPGRQLGDGPGDIFGELFAEGHPDYVTLVADRIQKHLFNDGELTPTKNAARLIERCDQVRRAFFAEAARWGFRSPQSWETAKNDYLDDILPFRTGAVLEDLRDAEIYPAFDAPSFNQHGGLVTPAFRVTMSSAADEVYYVSDGGDPRLPGGAIAPQAESIDTGLALLITAESGVSAHVPVDDTLGSTWKDPDFDDSDWISNAAGTGVGFDTDPDFLPHIDFSILDIMRHVNPSVYLRYEFDVNDPLALSEIKLRMKYDDGYVAFLNGEQIAARNAPDPLLATSRATAGPLDVDAVIFEPTVFTHAAPHELLRAGRNVLAIHGLNFTASSNDMLIEPEMTASRTDVSQQGITIERTTLIKARSRMGGEWSALTEAVFALDSSPLRITEVMYHPPELPAGSPFNSGDLEFIEFQNIGDRPINLTGIRITSAVEFSFPDNDAFPEDDLAPGEIVVVVSNLAGFESTYDTHGMRIAAEYDGKLDNIGERIVLLDRIGTLLVDFEYAPDWHMSTNGEGRSLVITDSSLDLSNWTNATSWFPSNVYLGSPGVPESGGPSSGGMQRPGDANHDGFLDIGDAIGLLLRMFGRVNDLPCAGESLDEGANLALLDFNGDEQLDTTDAVAMLRLLFEANPPLHVLGSRCVRIDGCPEVCSP